MLYTFFTSATWVAPVTLICLMLTTVLAAYYRTPYGMVWKLPLITVAYGALMVDTMSRPGTVLKYVFHMYVGQETAFIASCMLYFAASLAVFAAAVAWTTRLLSATVASPVDAWTFPSRILMFMLFGTAASMFAMMTEMASSFYGEIGDPAKRLWEAISIGAQLLFATCAAEVIGLVVFMLLYKQFVRITPTLNATWDYTTTTFNAQWTSTRESVKAWRERRSQDNSDVTASSNSESKTTAFQTASKDVEFLRNAANESPALYNTTNQLEQIEAFEKSEYFGRRER